MGAAILTVIGLVATALGHTLVAISDAAENRESHPSWLFRHTLGSTPATLGWWLVVLLPPAAFYVAARALDPEVTATVWGLTLAATLTAYVVLVAL